MSDQYDFVLAARYEFDVTSGDYCAVICKQWRDQPVMEVVACGVEQSEEMILVWLRETIRLMRQYQRTDVSVPDAIERALKQPTH
jgi:hypothetical protein